ncbi:UNKNOWN [Stylonychia lemnae]|uniref:Uncharacterized protein n=1 Tax=Stylonychia lemnae TaxID=5949 RepID=A0A078A094_STYLE|nr:UNKNOWN [Stylonychia lemnae]|eukprot:CDW75616.1 UNKNOWN [Stylonychia lemnae]
MIKSTQEIFIHLELKINCYFNQMTLDQESRHFSRKYSELRITQNPRCDFSTITPKININGDLFQVFPASPVSNRIKSFQNSNKKVKINRRIIGSIDYMKEGEQHVIRKQLEIKQKNSLSDRLKGNIFKDFFNKKIRSSIIDITTSRNQQQSRDQLSVVNSNNKKTRDSIRSVQFSSNYTTREDRSRSKFVKFPDQNAKEMINKIEKRIGKDQLENISSANFNDTIRSKVTNFSRVSSVGRLFLELQQEKVLLKHEQTQKEWQNQALKLGDKVNKTQKTTSKKFLQAIESKPKSIMLKNQDFPLKNQIASLKCKQVDLISQNAGFSWKMSLRESQGEEKEQLFIPIGPHSDINCRIIRQPINKYTKFMKQDPSNNNQMQDTEAHDFSQSLRGSKSTLSIIRNTRNSLPVVPRVLQSEQGFYFDTSKITENNVTLDRHELNQLQNLTINGESKYQKEKEYCMKIPNGERRLMLNHIYCEDGDAEPFHNEEIIYENYEPKFSY